MPIVAHCANPFLPLTTVWMYDQIRTLKHYQPVVLTQMVQNRDLFPFDHVLSVESLPYWKRQGYRVLRKIWGTYAGYTPWLKEMDAVLIHAHFGQEGYRCLSAKQGAGLPMVTTFYGMDASVLPRQKVWQKRFGRLFSEGDMFLAEGPCMAQRLVDIGCLPNKIVVQHIGVDLDRLPFVSPALRNPDCPIILTYAAFREKKGLVYALRAFAKIVHNHPKARLRMIGDGPLRQVLMAEMQALQIANRVDMLGFLSHEAAVAELKKAMILLYPSITAGDGDTEGGAPVALIEALAVGTAVVSSLHADIPNVVPPGKCGLLFGEQDVDGLAEGLDALLTTETLRKDLAVVGRAHVEKQHHLLHQAAKLEGLYDRLI